MKSNIKPEYKAELRALQQAMSKLYTHASIMQTHKSQDECIDLGL